MAKITFTFKIDSMKLTAEEIKIANLIIKKNGQIRMTKPKVDESNPLTGKAAYVWRMVMFAISPNRQHHCMPITADFDLPAYDESGKWRSPIAREMSNDLKHLEDEIVNSVPKELWHGVTRWGKAFGY